ncbi:MAG: nuclear transport factor 2 family protein [Alphaproteobacteria bacterium]|nr:nuclear transport factor 2 family protein [Alphaproteobacteria bacterium]
MSVSEAQVRAIFRNMETGNRPGFLAGVHDDVDWTVLGTHPLAGHYTSKASFVAATYERLKRLLVGDSLMTIVSVLVAGETAIVEMQGRATARNGDPYNNVFCWICTFRDGKIAKVRAYLDSALVQRLIDRNE